MTSPSSRPEGGAAPPTESIGEDRGHMNREAVRRALRRILTSPPEPPSPGQNISRLPDWKHGFPRMLCLDMNQWIYLAQAHYGRNPRPGAVLALQVIRRAIQAGRLIVPIANTNVLEVGETANSERRERLARFMVDLSTNLSLMNQDVIGLAECKAALIRNYQRKACLPFRSQLVLQGLGPATGVRYTSGNAAFNTIFSRVQESPEVSESFLAQGFHGSVRRREGDERALRLFREIRALDGKLPLEERRRLEIRNTFEDGRIADRLFLAADELGIERDALRNWLNCENNRLKLCASIPSLEIVLELIVARARNKDDVNDLKDYSFLTVVVPYANYVVTERSWAHLLNTSGIARRYRTHVFGNLPELSRRLENDLVNGVT